MDIIFFIVYTVIKFEQHQIIPGQKWAKLEQNNTKNVFLSFKFSLEELIIKLTSKMNIWFLSVIKIGVKGKIAAQKCIRNLYILICFGGCQLHTG